MYKVCEILTPEERLGAIQLGMIRAFASNGVGPGEAARLMKSAAPGDKGSVESWITAMLKLGLGIGIPIGTLSYALRSSLKPKTKQNMKLRAGLDQYNDIVAQYKRQINDKEKEEEDKDKAKAIDYGSQYVSFPSSSGVKAAQAKGFAEKHPILTLGAGGVLTGGAIAAISAMITDHIEAKRQRKLEEERNSDKVSPDTIVLHVRNPAQKTAQVCEGPECPGADDKGGQIPQTKPGVKVEPTVSSKDLKYMSGPVQPRETNGRFASSTLGKSAQFSWGGMAREGVGLALFAGGVPLGYSIVGKLHKKLEENRLKSQIEAAQQEYVSLLDGTYADGDKEKKAECEEFASVIGMELNDGLEKDAQSSGDAPKSWMGKLFGLVGKGVDKINTGVFGRNLQHFGGGAIAAGLLSAAASAYITRKLLQAKFDKANEEDGDEPEKVTRILFKSGSAEIEVSPAQALFTIAVMRDYLKDGLPEKTAQAAQAKPEYDFGWLDELSASPEGRQAMLDLYSQHMGWGKADAKSYMPAIVKAVSRDPSKDRSWYRSAMAMRDPETLKKYMPEIQRRMYANVQNDPEAWFKMIGDKRNNAIVEGGINKWIANRQQQGGFLGWLMGLPGLGGLVKKWMGSYARGTERGRRMVGRNFLRMAGVDDRMADAMTSRERIDYSGRHGGNWAYREGVAPVFTPVQPNRPAYLNNTPDSAGTPAEGAPPVDNVFDPVDTSTTVPETVPGTAPAVGAGDHTGGASGAGGWGGAPGVRVKPKV